ncbi:MAG: DUF983 domain-containing protein [Saprospiraceae bacterium]|nr:DUF983 domain-containing protein [Saprospiraceae bacterium]
MISKGSKLYSILYLKCPQCQEEDMFKYNFLKSIPYLLKGDYQMNQKCSKCGLTYEMEPGFWWGAMYMGYLMSSGALLITGAIAYIKFGLGVNETMLVVLLVACIGFLFNARIARAVWINLYVNYKNYPK